MMKKIFLVLTIAFIQVVAFAQIDRSKAPEPKANPKIEINIPDPMNFANGLEVIMVENHKLPVVSFQLYIDYPIPMEGDKSGLRSIFGEMLACGTSNTPKDKFDEAIDYMGASFYPNSRGFYASSLKKHSPKLLTLLNEVLTEPAFEQVDFDRIIDQNLSNLASIPSDANSMLGNVSDVVKYGKNHPYGEIMTEETLNNIELQDIKDFYRRYFTPNKAYLVVVGDVTRDDVKNYVETYFTSWKKGEDIQKQEFEAPTTSGKQVYFVDKPGAVQSVISIGHNINLTPGHEDEIKLKVMNQILGGGSFSARLMSNLREDKAYTYGCYSSLSSDQLVGSFSAGGSFRNEVTDSAIVQILAEIERITSEAVSETELDLVKKSMTGAFARSLESPQTIANFALNIVRYNLPKNYYAEYLQKLERVTASDILNVADKYLSPNNINIFVVGNEDIAEKLKVFDNDGEVDFKDYYGKKVDRLKEIPADVTTESVIYGYAMKMFNVKSRAELEEKLKSVQQIESISAARFDAAAADILVYEVDAAPNKTANYTIIRSIQGTQPMATEWFNGENGELSEMGNPKPYEGKELEQKKIAQFPVSQIKYLNDPEITADLLGIKTIDGVEYYKMKVVNANKEGTSFEYYDVATGLLKKIERIEVDAEGNENTAQFEYSDYQEMDGLFVAKTMTMNNAGQVIKFEKKWISTGKKAKAKALSGNFKVAKKLLSNY